MTSATPTKEVTNLKAWCTLCTEIEVAYDPKFLAAYEKTTYDVS
jgi:hypothetical protein